MKNEKEQDKRVKEELKALAHLLGVFEPFGNEEGYYLTVAQIHAERVMKVGNKVKIVSEWKGEKERDVCEQWIPKEGSKGYKKCGKPLTHSVSWEIDRFYGKKHAVEVFCEEHAKAFAKRLKKGDKLYGGEIVSYEPIEIRNLEW